MTPHNTWLALREDNSHFRPTEWVETGSSRICCRQPVGLQRVEDIAVGSRIAVKSRQRAVESAAVGGGVCHVGPDPLFVDWRCHHGHGSVGLYTRRPHSEGMDILLEKRGIKYYERALLTLLLWCKGLELDVFEGAALELRIGRDLAKIYLPQPPLAMTQPSML